MREWVKVWRPRPGSAFEARVSGPARMLFRGLLAYLDDDGVLYLPRSKHLHYALGMAVGYSKDERRALKKQLAELVAHECLEASQDDAGFWTLRATGWDRFQAPKKGDRSPPSKPKKKPRPEHAEGTAGADSVHDGCTTGAELVQTHEAKCPESRDGKKQDQRREEERESRAREATFEDPMRELEEVSAGRLPTRMWGRVMLDHGGGPWDECLLRGTDTYRLSDMREFAESTADLYAAKGASWAEVYFEVLAGSMRAFLDDHLANPERVHLKPGFWFACRNRWKRAA